MVQPTPPRLRRRFIASFSIAATLLLLGVSLRADATKSLPKEPMPKCYCGCAVSHTRGGCVRMCELKKYAARWWATNCAKHRGNPPADTRGAGPRYPHPGRFERASNDAQPAPGAKCPPNVLGKRR
jgi:hypothetical protein